MEALITRAGKITGLSASTTVRPRCDQHRGTLLQVRFKAKSAGETELALQNFQFGSTTGEAIPAGPHQIQITVEGRLATGDVNQDGIVSILDLILVAQQLGRRVPAELGGGSQRRWRCQYPRSYSHSTAESVTPQRPLRLLL